MFSAKLWGSKLLFVALIFFVILGLLIYSTWLVEPSSPSLNINFSNITDHQVSISWVTNIPTKGTIIVSSDSKFPILPIFAKDIQKDDGEKNTEKIGYYITHHITIGNLSPQKNYQFRIYQGQKKVYEGQFITAPTLASLTSPNPVYGRVIKSDKTPVAGTLIFLRAGKDASPSSQLSTLTNAKGGWSLDLANLRLKDLKNVFKVDSKTKEELVVVNGNKGSFKAETTYGSDKPWPDIILK